MKDSVTRWGMQEEEKREKNEPPVSCFIPELNNITPLLSVGNLLVSGIGRYRHVERMHSQGEYSMCECIV